MAKRIITINRMFGSNGRLIGKTLDGKSQIAGPQDLDAVYSPQ